MLVVDSSAVLAMMFDEPEGATCAAELGTARSRVISAVNHVESGTVLAGRAIARMRDEAINDLDDFLASFRIDIAPVTDSLAREARIRYGKGFDTWSGLNFGDCFAYALSRSLAAPLLFVGNDFAMTDTESALGGGAPLGRSDGLP